MLSNKQEKLVRSLQQKKFRNEQHLFVIEGEKMIREAEEAGFTFHSFYCCQEGNFKNEYQFISEREMKKISSFKSPPGMLAVLPTFQLKARKQGLCLLLDEINDPGNLGTIIRSAEAFRVREIVCSENTVDLFNPKVVQASMGSIFRVPVQYRNLIELLEEIPKNSKVYGASLDGENLYTHRLDPQGYLLMGSESHGIAKELYAFVNQKIYIPQQGKVESLNVSIATAIILSEFNRPV